MTKFLIDNEPGIKVIAQVGMDDRYHFVCKNEHEGQVRRLFDEYFDQLSNYFDSPESLHEITSCNGYQ